MIDWNKPLTVCLTLAEISSITLALKRAEESYKAQNLTDGVHWPQRRAVTVREQHNKLWAIEYAHYLGNEVGDECLAAIETASQAYNS